MIKEFFGETKWLSNFALVDIELDGIEYPSTEHGYMSLKNDSNEWKTCCRGSNDPYADDYMFTCGQIRRLGQEIRLKPNWDSIRLESMRKVLVKKFIQEPFRSQLLATGDEELQEGNNHGDRFYGVDLATGEGENHLGKLIMEIREQLRKEQL